MSLIRLNHSSVSASNLVRDYRNILHHAKAGDVLIHEHQTGREFLVIVDGTASVVADTDVLAEVGSRTEFAALVAGSSPFVRGLLLSLAQRVRAADRSFGDDRPLLA